MREVFLNDFRIALKQKAMYAMLLVLAVLGFLTGLKFHMSVGDGLAVNAPYSLGFMIGLLSLVNIFSATFLAFLMLFKEIHVPIRKQRSFGKKECADGCVLVRILAAGAGCCLTLPIFKE